MLRRYSEYRQCAFDCVLHPRGAADEVLKSFVVRREDKLKRFGLLTRLGEQAFFATIDEAVSAYRAIHPVEWVD